MTDSPRARLLYVVSWNVASWKTGMREIVKRHGSFDTWLHALQPDVLCLQETKLCDAELDKSPAALGAIPDGYTSFWACNEGKGAQTKGLNGVCTFVRSGLAVRAERHALREDVLDKEGRCLLVELRNAVVVINVYVPNSGDGRLLVKLRFLDALATLIHRETVAGKRVILCGDLNLQTRALDTHWKKRQLDLAGLAAAARAGVLDRATLWPPVAAPLAAKKEGEREAEQRAILEGRALELARLLAGGYERLAAALAAAEIRECETINTTTGKRFKKYKLFIPVPAAVPSSGDAAAAVSMQAVGRPMEECADVEHMYRLKTLWMGPDGRQREPNDDELAAGAHAAGFFELHQHGLMRMEQVRDTIGVLLGGNTNTLERFTDETWAQLGLAAPFVHASTEVAVQAHFEALCAAGGHLVDSFLRAHPHALDRFTCWNQFTQERFVNVGSRIDYILVPSEMVVDPDAADAAATGFGAATGCSAAPSHATGGGAVGSAGSACSGLAGLAAGKPPRAQGIVRSTAPSRLRTGGTVHDPDSPAAALAAATANGRWRPVSFAGGGYVDGQAKDYWLHLDEHTPHTGIIYTPPQYSDHVAVSALVAYDFAKAQAERAAQGLASKFGLDVQPYQGQLKQQGFFSSWRSKAPPKREAGADAAVAEPFDAAPAHVATPAPANPEPRPPSSAATQPAASESTRAPPAKVGAKARAAASKAEPPKKQQRGAMDAFVRRGS